MRKLRTGGFTIIELLISTVIFSVVLLVITGAIVQFSRIHYKGNITSRTQDTARTIMNTIAQDIQFGGGDAFGDLATVPVGTNEFEAGAKCYRFSLNTMVSSAQHGLAVRDGSCSTNTARQTELLGENMQLVALSAVPVVNLLTGDPTNLVTVRVHIVYGDNADLDSTKQQCNSLKIGGQFCAVAELSTTVAKRVE